MPISKLLTDAVVNAAKGISKTVLNELLQSVKGDNKGAIVPYRSEGNKNIICFVHGFSGDAESTFDPLPKFIVAEQELAGWDILSIGYATDIMPNIGRGLWAANPDITKIAGYLRTNLEILFSHYERVALIGHSMGGLVIQRAILNMEDIHKVSHVLFFGTPSAGLKKAWFLRWFKKEIADMDYSGPFIKSLRSEWNERFKEEYPFRFTTVAGELDEFVPTASSIDPFPEKYRSHTAGNHVTMVKPETANDTSFQIIKKVLYAPTDYLLGFDYRTLNNTIAQYYEDVNVLSKEPQGLDKNGLKKLVFALEGTGRIDDAITAIEQSNAINTSTDFMGILGGRWKRKYLMDEKGEYLEKAIWWYDKALKLSTEADNSNQIFYHSINLAFLHLMDDNTDLNKTKKMAQMAMDHCAKSEHKDYWHTATVAEAHLYLGNFDECKKHYTQAIAGCNKSVRETSSMMINAFYACNSLNKPDWKAELETIFLGEN